MSRGKKIIIKIVPSPLYKRIVGVFTKWFVNLELRFEESKVELQLASNEGLSL
jgi:hypothetical protein